MMTEMKRKKEEEYEYKNIEYHKLNSIQKACNYDNKLEIEECPLIQYIIDSLLLFKKNKL